MEREESRPPHQVIFFGHTGNPSQLLEDSRLVWLQLDLIHPIVVPVGPGLVMWMMGQVLSRDNAQT